MSTIRRWHRSTRFAKNLKTGVFYPQFENFANKENASSPVLFCPEKPFLGFLRGCFFSQNKQPIEIGAQISLPKQPIRRLQNREKNVPCVPEKFLIHHCRWSNYSILAHNPYINIRESDAACYSYVGFPAWGHLSMNLYYYGCLSQRVIEHEFLHALGIYHEQSRPDRDNHITVHFDNILSDKAYNYNKLSITQWLDLNSPYDTNSVMHYSRDF